MGHQIFKIKEDLGQFLTETTFKLQISHIQCYHGYLKVLISIFWLHLDCYKVGITLSSKQQPQQQLGLIGWAFSKKKSLIDEQSGVCLLRGEGGGTADII